jgi:hypothetical protein
MEVRYAIDVVPKNPDPVCRHGMLIQAACLPHDPPVIAPPAAGASTDPKPTELRYALPKTTVVLDLQVERTVQAPGKYATFSTYSSRNSSAPSRARSATRGSPATI